MARIYLARSRGPGQFEKLCALKLIRPDFSADGSVSDLLLREASIAARLHHPSIVQVFDLGHYEDEYYMAMEWVEGVSLAHLLTRVSREGRLLNIEQVVHIASRVAEALEYLRSGVILEGKPASLVHRDVSPSNVLVSTNGTVKLTDFGIVKVLEAPSSTRVGVVKGKYAYMSPEQLRGDPVDHRADIFALGVVMFEALTCRRLFHRKTLAATVAAVHAARVLPPSALEDVPHELDRVVLKCLAKRPDDRYQGAGEMLAELESFASTAAPVSLGREVTQVLLTQKEGNFDDPHRSVTSLPALNTPPPLPDSTDIEDLPDLRNEEFAALEEDLLEEPNHPDSTIRYAEPIARLNRNTPTDHVASQGSSEVPAEMLMAQSPSFVARMAPAAILILTLLGIAAFWWSVLNGRA
ncbi:MAG: serine/threonine protein kinase [Myxococcales bacterium]|nr:serine/threonine protein kinase [Myxococcales bacterium]MCB9650874.1 serine/threonine protein kinase [Deltaproteobacteria bacterium]